MAQFSNYDDNITYSPLYNWYTVNTGKLCPTDWHVPSDTEWKTLEMYLGMSQAQADSVNYRGNDEGGKMKETGLTHWWSPNKGATNTSLFTAFGSGDRYSSTGYFANLQTDATYHTNTSYNTDWSYIRTLHFNLKTIKRMDMEKERNGGQMFKRLIM